MIYFVDIDETICDTPEDRDYSKSQPKKTRIKKINFLYEQGHTIIYWTARGTVTGKDWSSITKEQFKEWGVKYHKLEFGKPFYDLFIDDRNINDKSFFKD